MSYRTISTHRSFAVQGGLPAGKALPIVKARLQVGAVDQSKPVAPEDKGIPFTVTLKAGPRTAM